VLKPLLVTGAHRSGSTWVGKMLAAGGAYAYVSEPLNRYHRPGVMRVPTPHWYEYICADNESTYLEALRETLALDYHLGRELLSLRSLKDLGRMLRDLREFTRGQIGGRAALLKDPFAAFSAPWFAERLGCAVVITLRHPAAFASSLKRLNWTFNFRHWLDQPLLMRDLLGPYEAEMRAASSHPDDLLLRASTLWRILYKTLHSQKDRHPDFLWVRHEDLSLDPLNSFAVLYSQLDLPFNARARRVVANATGEDNPNEVSRGNIYAVQLNSRANLKNWTHRLSIDEITRIKDLTADIWPLFYEESDWQP
jgi:hypothetical protein